MTIKAEYVVLTLKYFDDYFIFYSLQINQINLNIIRAFYYINFILTETSAYVTY